MVRISDYVRPPRAAEIIGCTPGRVYQMLRAGDFSDTIKVDESTTLISRREAEKIAQNPAKTGRPRKRVAS